MPQGRRHGSQTRGLESVAKLPGRRGFFGRMFHQLPVFEPDEQQLEDLASEMVERQPDVKPAGDNKTVPAGFTYFGQFVDHDLTFDRSSTFEQMFDPDQLRNFRTPRFDLDSVYGRGPKNSPELYDKESDGTKLLVGENPDTDPDTGIGLEKRDLPRNNQGIAVIGDPRNDENIIVSQLQLAFIRFHNRVVEQVRDDQGLQEDELFKEAHRIVRFHYQWIVVHDFLDRIAPEGMVDRMLRPEEDPPVKLRFFGPKDGEVFMPVEFSVAAYRFGHSAVRPTYSINNTVQGLPIFSKKKNPDPLEAFHGGRRLPAQWTISWPFFFELDNKGPQLARKLNTKLAEGLFELPGERGKMRSLALRNLRRGKALGLPSGQRLARAMSREPLTPKELGFKGPAPAWFYVLREAELKGEPRGQRLGPVGGRIVAEVLLGLLAFDPLSYINVEPDWTPQKDKLRGQAIRSMADLIRFATPDQAERF